VKQVLEWIKGHVVVVVCSVLIVVSLPTAFVMSSGWSTSVREEQTQTVTQEHGKVSNLEVTYVVPPASPDAEPIERRYVPNEAYIERFRELIAAQREDQRRAEALALAFNRHTPVYLPDDEADESEGSEEAGAGAARPAGVVRDRPQTDEEAELERELLGWRVEVPPHEVVMPGLLPEPPNPTRGEELTLDFVREFSGLGRADGLGRYGRLLYDGPPGEGDPIAGLPPEPERVALALERRRQQFIDGLGPRSGETPDLSPEEQEELTEELRSQRLAVYGARAGELSFYLDPAILPGVNPQNPVPSSLTMVPLWRVFELNWDYWMLKDLLAALGRANTNERGRRLDVEDGAVKRVVSIGLEPLPIGRGPAGGPGPREGDRRIAANRPSQPERDGYVGVWEGWSLTGRLTHPGNQLYDVRQATLELIVDQRQIARVLDAFPQTNLMTVLDMDIERIDVWDHLREGFLYGEAPVVRLSLTVETIWLREWTVPIMPERVRRDLDVRDDAGEGGQRG